MKSKESTKHSPRRTIRYQILFLLLFLAGSLSTCNTPTPTPTPRRQQGAPPSAQRGLIPGYEGVYKPVGFVNHGSKGAMIMPCTWIPLGSQEQAPPPSASTISSPPGSPGLWPNPSRFLSLPLGTYTWCIQWDEGDQNGDGIIDYFFFIDDRPVTLTEEDSDDLEFARQVDFSAPPGSGTNIFSGTCDTAHACSEAGTIAHLVAKASAKDLGGSGQQANVEYDKASISLFIDPARTNWIAWNNLPGVSLTRKTRPGEVFLGPGGFGTDDYIAVTVTNPDGQSLTIELDHNDPYGRSKGPQNVIYGNAEAAPDVFRQNPNFADPPGKEFFLDEEGSHNSIFTSAGNYEFHFSFRNKFTSSVGHPDIYLLVSSR